MIKKRGIFLLVNPVNAHLHVVFEVFGKEATLRGVGPCPLMGVSMAHATPGHHLLAVPPPERRIRNGAFLGEPGGRGFSLRRPTTAAG